MIGYQMNKFVSPFTSLGDDWLPNEEILEQLEIFVCILFRSHRLKKVNDVRYNIFQQKYQKDDKIIDLSLLPPSQQTLRLHILRSTYVAKLWCSALINNIEVPDITVHGLQTVKLSG